MALGNSETKTVQLRFGLEPTLLVEITGCQDLVKLRSLMSYHRKNPLRVKVIHKKWVYLSETYSAECRPS